MGSDLCDILAYQFTDQDVLKKALRHSSTTAVRTHSNERLEFLGDRVLGLTIAEILYQRFPDEEEGPLARRFSGLTSREALARVADGFNLRQYLIIQDVDAETQKRSHSSVVADTLEAILGAMFLDGGLKPAQTFIAKHWEALICENLKPPIDAKTALQEWAQARSLGLPEYLVTDRDGPDHAPIFTVCVVVKGREKQNGQGKSRRSAEQNAAHKLLMKLETET